MGHAGVDFFFVLSGFIIAWVHWEEAGDFSRLSEFLKKRVLRIYPAYWVVLAAILPVYFLVPSFGMGYETDMDSILTSFLLLPNTHQPILPVAWTLCHEMLFYAMFAILFVNTRAGKIALALWFFGCVLQLLIQTDRFPITFLFSPINLLFLFGIIAANVIRRNSVPLASMFVLIGVTLFALAGYLDVQKLGDRAWLTLLYGFGSTLTVLGMIELERGGRFPVPRLLIALGNASYSLYLVHYVVLPLGGKVYFKLGGGGLPVTGFFVLLGIAIAAGFAFHFMVEKPLLRLFKARSVLTPVKVGSRPSLS